MKCLNPRSNSSSRERQTPVLMVESEAKELSEQVMLGAVMFGHRSMQPVIDAIIRLAERAAKEPRGMPTNEAEPTLAAIVESAGGKRTSRGLSRFPKRERGASASCEIRDRAKAELAHESGQRRRSVKSSVQGSRSQRHALCGSDTQRRIDGRDLKTVRPIRAEVGVLPRTHGSALFTRGETQALVVATLGHRRG